RLNYGPGAVRTHTVGPLDLPPTSHRLEAIGRIGLPGAAGRLLIPVEQTLGDRTATPVAWDPLLAPRHNSRLAFPVPQLAPLRARRNVRLSLFADARLREPRTLRVARAGGRAVTVSIVDGR